MNELLREHTFTSGQRLEIVQGDLTQQKADAIVNAANTHLQHGGGVAGQIVRRGGREIQRESDDWILAHGRVSHAEPAYTTAGSLPARYVIHAVGPVWGEGNEDEKLAAAVQGSLRRADELRLSSIAMPAISTGIFGFPEDRAARIILDTVFRYYRDHPDSGLTLVRQVLYDLESAEVFAKQFDLHAGQS